MEPSGAKTRMESFHVLLNFISYTSAALSHSYLRGGVLGSQGKLLIQKSKDAGVYSLLNRSSSSFWGVFLSHLSQLLVFISD